MLSDPTSTPDKDYEGSGTPEPTIVKGDNVISLEIPIVTNYPRYFRVTINITSIIYKSALGDRGSQEFAATSQRLQADLEALFRNIAGRPSVTILQFSKGSLLVTFDLGSQGEVTEEQLVRVLNDAIRSGRIGSNSVSAEGFSFTPLDTTVNCPPYVGRNPDKLPRNGTNWANLLINNAFPCDGSVVGWQYYRLIPQGTAYVGVWRQTDSGFELVRKTALPPGRVGIREVVMPDPIPVQKGDFIGIFYPRNAPNNVIAQAQIEDDFVSSEELYQNYYVQLFDEMIQPGVPLDITSFPFQTNNATFSLRAVMDYGASGSGGQDEGYTCKPGEFACGDGYCIQESYVCDGQEDCPNNIDEQNCKVSTSPEPCLEGRRFRCNDGTCINPALRCDGKVDCADGSDEKCCNICFPVACSAEEFTCRSRECVPSYVQCNGEKDCMDGSDEENCPQACKADEFTCNDGTCIQQYQVCDAYPECPDNSDEDPRRCLQPIPTVPPPCSENMFRCDNGACVSSSRICDGRDDCRDGSDESQCESVRCREGEFRCAVGRCIDIRRQCDGSDDCPDRSDEVGCVVTCNAQEFTCENGECVDLRYRCDGAPNCRDRSDEEGCPCRSSEFQCGNRRCIPQSRVCDRRADCTDGSDEEDCAACRRNEFECEDGTCIDLRLRCDRSRDCPDTSDEFNCTCNFNEHRCRNGQCVLKTAVCDQRRDCVDGSDELNCRPVCRGDQFTCANGDCIDKRRTCDGRNDCRDNSDEQGCPPIRVCQENQFLCGTGHCLDSRRRCDRRRDCPDGSDEIDCPTCSPNEFTCGNGQCISTARRCDRRNDCDDGSDERSCPCRSGEFTCVNDGRCLPAGYKCNGNPECTDGSDELNCVRECSEREFRCSNNECIPSSSLCDGRLDCPDGVDERNCAIGVTVSISPQQMRKRVGTSASFICQASGNPPARITWTRRTGGAMPPQAQISNNRLTITDLRLEDAGDYMCKAVSTGGSAEAIARLAVEYVGPSPGPTSEPGPCGRDEATCSNGQCIPRDYLCDGEDDCTDKSDEANCNVLLPCEPNEFRCNNGRCALKIWRCDGDNDCGDRSDEFNCTARIPGAPCQVDEFQCRDSEQCIPFSYQCDGEIDCQDRSDEIGCTQPTIVTPPQPEITVEVNGTFTIICEAVGVPTPLIVWRLNWGNIPTGDRVSVTSVNGRGNLTISNAVPEDAGAYTCEAINNRGSIFAVPDALIIVRRTIGICRPPRFNIEAKNENECVRCFCYGQTQTCSSSNLQLSQITLGNQVSLVRRTTLEPAEPGFVQYIPSSREFQVTDFNNVLRTGSYYWSLPYQYLSKRLSSYGGELSYRVYYEVDGFDVPTSDPDIILIGNGITLYHRSKTTFRPRAPTTVKIPLVESAWERSRDSPRGGPISEYATREDLMMVLENVTHILIRATYDNRQSLIRMGNVLLTTGVTQNTGLGKAVFVEDCSCPTGYTGYSCEDCAPGFYRVERGRYSRECIACNCNGHSNDCDPLSGICRNCGDNTRGPYCNECAVGFVGDPRSGRPDACQPCPCPLTTPSNQFSRTCVIQQDREITCTACPAGYTGRRCERCADNYVGNPLSPGDNCRPRESLDVCDPRGSLRNLPNYLTRQCECKTNAMGTYCNTCKPDTFYLDENNPAGCIACFCMGVTQICESTAWNRAAVSLAFSQSPAEVTLTDLTQIQRIDEGLLVDRQSRELIYRGFNNLESKQWYWSLPQQFLGNKVTAYGGNLRFTLRHRTGRDSSPLNTRDPLIEIGGNDLTLVYRPRTPVQEGRQQSFSVPFIETEWYRADGLRTTREHLLMALADLDYILIRATHLVDTDESAISSISLDVAEDRNTGRDRAYPVEQCVCPQGYKGLSCEDCDSGFTRTGGGLYLGLCEPCKCNKHSTECDSETGVCRNCRHNTEGDNCERCARGYYGVATRGTVNDCQKCPCPLTESPNQFSSDCILAPDGQVTCTACPAGHTGRRCERCANGYQGNPNQPGDYCKVINVTCDCDPRGTVPNTLCDPNSKQCQCKNNVQGRRCSACKEGFFNLARDSDAGCLKCFCSGITNICTSSNYYRDEIRPLFNADGTHNFAVTNRRLSRTFTDGFTVNAERNEITFNNFEGIQIEQESLFIQLPPKFRGDKVSSYGGYLRFGLSYTTSKNTGNEYNDVDVEIISNQDKRIYHLSSLPRKAQQFNNFEIHLVESSFKDPLESQEPSRESFLTVLADIQAILIRATYHRAMNTLTIRDLRMDIAVPRPTGQSGTPEVESCTCPEGYTGLSCQECAAGYLRVEDPRTALGRCTRCICNGHATSCDTVTGVCQNCLHNTEGDRCERCVRGYYGDPTSGTPNDCRVCPCPLTIPSNSFSPTCLLDQDNRVTCDRCQNGYTGRDCGQCAPGFTGNPREPGGRCERRSPAVEVIVSPTTVTEPLGSSVIFQCIPRGRGPFNVVWSRLDGRPLPSRATSGPGPNYPLTIPELEYADAARYVCSVTNADGSSRDYATLTVERPELPIKIRIEEPIRLVRRPGQSAVFTCVAIQYSSEANYVLSWMKDGGPLPSKVIDQNGVLMIPNLDENDIGTYTCTGSEPGSIDRATATITFGELLEAPTVRIEPRYLQVKTGARVEFRCVAGGNPRPAVRWTKGRDGPLPSYVYTDETGVLRIESVRMEDQSEYHCTATNSEGTATIRTIIYVEEQVSIQIIVRRTNITATVGQREQLICYAEGGDDVNLIWTREGGLPPGTTQENGVLTLANIQRSYAGNYICTGTVGANIVGRVTARVTVTGSRGTAPTVRIEPEGQVIGTGMSGTIRCVVTGEPRPTVTWTKARSDLSSNIQVDGDTLRIIQATMEDRGIYTCTATNVAGRSQASTRIDIERREFPEIQMYPDNQQTRAAGNSALFQCRVVKGEPSPTVTWARAGGRRFSERAEIKENGVLMFNSLTVEDQGEYICTAVNELGTVSATASLRVEGPPTIEIKPGKNIIVVTGQRVYIECIGLGEPVPNVFWRSGQRRRSDVLPEEKSGPGMARLEFSSIKKTDEGNYICVATNDRGRTEETVDIVVNDRGDVPIGVNIEGPQQLSYTVGQSVELTCNVIGLVNPRIRWRRPNNRPLPPNHSVGNGKLFIPRIEPGFDGEYICTVTSDVTAQDYSASVFITVQVSPRVLISPSQVSARAGSSITLTCQTSGPGPFNYEWTREDGQLSTQARQVNGVLEIRQATRADSGRYKCTVLTPGGTIEAYADIRVLVGPTAKVSPKQINIVPGTDVELRCAVSGDPRPTVNWRKENGELPPQHNARNDIFTIYNVQNSDAGTYVCSVANEVGESRDFSILRVSDSEVREAGNMVISEGEQLELNCVSQNNDTYQSVKSWFKKDGQISPYARFADGLLIIDSVTLSDAGEYICEIVYLGTRAVTKVNIIVKRQTAPRLAVQEEYATAALGTPVQLRCDSSQPRTWVKEGGDLPEEHKLTSEGDLYISRVRDGDEGRYNCMSQDGRQLYPVVLIVSALVPYFKHSDGRVSYLAFQPLSDAYNEFDIKLSFRPETTDGMVLYNGHFVDMPGDFLCFGLSGQYPEFRFDAGSGPAIIRGKQPLALNQWHTVQLKREKKNGTMFVNDEPAYRGEAPGQFEGLDLGSPMYVGGVPAATVLSPSVGFRSGFVGGLSEIVVNGVNYNLGANAIAIENVEQYPVCQDRPCQYGQCRPYNNRYGFRCECNAGFAGDRCEIQVRRCSQETCGSKYRCIDLPLGPVCVCPFGFYGEQCSRNVRIADPSFNKTSFITYPKIQDGLITVKVSLEFLPRSLDDGIILYNAQRTDGKQDYIAIIIKNRHLEFRFDTGSGPAILRSRQPLVLNEWTRVIAERKGRDGKLTINNEEPVNEQVRASDRQLFPYSDRGDITRGSTSGSRTIGLNLERPLYLGGVDPAETVNKGVGTLTGFVGCVGELIIGDTKVRLQEDAIETLNVRDCGVRYMCSRLPCRNNGRCTDISFTEYRCTCSSQFTGQNCETEITACSSLSPCENGGTCVASAQGFKCNCPLGYMGETCSAAIELGTSVELVGDGYVELDKSKFIHLKAEALETFSLVIRTTEKNGLLFWQGQRPGEQQNRDYLAVFLKDGFVNFHFELGSGAGQLISKQPVDDGFNHNITVQRRGQNAKLLVSNQPEVAGRSNGALRVLNVLGNVFLGGVPDFESYTTSLFEENFAGCLSDVSIKQGSIINFSTDTVGGANVTPCLPAK
ncbi:unnamed protein product [Lymnaea stagnalis]|uniref:Basement membrane-specific heparan sulfate proteoglycan core protein n=1 Tax=Lymnaea stagnalis TaxID=6523 RepID=A0AAV2IIN3_LYMST